jgi:predicted acylesterase/phospholipase RssA
MSTETSVKIPSEQCDLVMTGGVTSGVVYPAVLVALKNRYRFRCIGGASAGAIAAATAAAAEFNRENDDFKALNELSNTLGKNGVLSLFKAPRKIQPLLDTVLDITQPTSPSKKIKPVVRASVPTLPERFWEFTERLIPALEKNNPESASTGHFIGSIVGAALAILQVIMLSLAVFAVICLFLPTAAWQNISILIILGIILGLIGIVSGIMLGRKLGGPLHALFYLIRIALFEIPNNNYYGICLGHDTETPEGKSILTDWLHDQLNIIAGLNKRDDVLTFGHLAEKKFDLQDKEDPPGIVLRMVTTNLSHGQPYTLPTDLEGFLFCEDEMRQFFPAPVVDHMICHAMKKMPIRLDRDKVVLITQEHLAKKENGRPKFYFLPHADDLPVIFATRLSLSFPGLLSAAPLYTISYAAAERIHTAQTSKQAQDTLGLLDHPNDLQRNWFSDGGISSNFPIHFFDAWLPTRPTFGITLTSIPDKQLETPNTTATLPHPESSQQTDSQQIGSITPEQVKTSVSVLATSEQNTPSASAHQQDDPSLRWTNDVYLPRADDPMLIDYQAIDSFTSFLLSVVFTSANYRDNLQARLPSYRERVIQIRLAGDEGGYNLNMPPKVVQRIIAKGTHAGERLKDFDLGAHQWVRFQVLMCLLEQNLRETKKTLEDEHFRQILKQGEEQARVSQPSATYPYPRPENWRIEAIARVDNFLAMINEWQKTDEKWPNPPLFVNGAPQPIPVLRVTPPV